LLGRADRVYFPGHGPAIPEPKPYVRSLIQHRHERAAAIVDSIAAGHTTVAQLVRTVYPDLAPELRWAAGQSVLAHLVQLVEAGEVVCDGRPGMDARYRLGKRNQAGAEARG
jgi:hypothetical protein